MRENSEANISAPARLMKAVCVHHFGGVDVMAYEEMPRPFPGQGQVLVRVKAAGVGPWDAWVRAGKSALTQPLPLVLGSDLSGVIAQVGENVTDWQAGDEIFGVTNPQFTGAYAEYAVAEAAMIARKPNRLNHLEAASVPVVACTAWQMLFDHGQADSTKRVLVHGAAGNVGAYAVQFARSIGAQVTATAFGHDLDYVRKLGAERVIDSQEERFEQKVRNVDVVIDTVGGEMLDRSFTVLKPGGVVVSSVVMPNPEKASHFGVRGVFFLVNVTSEGLSKIAGLIDARRLTTHVGEVLPLAEAHLAHEMLSGRSHRRGKIVLEVDA